ncbi:hypothetical protein FS837_007203 [Tulasnella sp. UAMH 9824]|nr:hypothetical protein FS837_007203 [Tulasnella sp. UAMH 9824]
MDSSDTLPRARLWHSQTLEPGTPVTSTLPDNEARIQPSRTPIDIAVHRLPAEIWIAVCDALRRLDLIDATNWKKPGYKPGYKPGWNIHPELYSKTTNKYRPDPIITARSILQLSHTCRYLHKVTSTSLLETIRLGPASSGGDLKSRCLLMIQQAKSLHLNSDQRLQHVRAFAVAMPPAVRYEYSDYGIDEIDLRNQICHLLPRFPNLRHLTVIDMPLDAPFMHTILTLPLEHLYLWHVWPDNPIADHTFNLTTIPKIELRSLVLKVPSVGRLFGRSKPSIPISWTHQLIGAAMQELSIEAIELVEPVSPTLPDLEFLEVLGDSLMDRIRPGVLNGLLSKTPNLKEAVLDVKAAPGDPTDTRPALSRLERVMCHASWLPILVPRRPITTVNVLCDYQVRVQELFEILHEGSVPLRDLSLTYVSRSGPQTWSPDDLEPIGRYLPELETLHLKIWDSKVGKRTM